MKGYICRSCDTILDRDEIVEETTTDPYCTGDSPDWIEWSCPNRKCRSDAIEEIWICDECEERESGDGIDECEVCFSILEMM